MPIFVQFFPSCCKKINFNPRGLLDQTYLIFTQCSGIIAADNVCIHMALLQRVNAVNLDVYKRPLQLTGYHSNVPGAITK